MILDEAVNNSQKAKKRPKKASFGMVLTKCREVCGDRGILDIVKIVIY